MAPHLQHLHLVPQAFSAEFHHRVGAEGVPYLVLVDGGQPEEEVVLQLQRRDQDGLVTGIDAARRKWRLPPADSSPLEHCRGEAAEGRRGARLTIHLPPAGLARHVTANKAGSGRCGNHLTEPARAQEKESPLKLRKWGWGAPLSGEHSR